VAAVPESGGSPRAFRSLAFGLALAVRPDGLTASELRPETTSSWVFPLGAGEGNRTCTISLGTGLSHIADHSICSSEMIFLVRGCPLQTVADRPIGHARGTTVDVAPRKVVGRASSAIATAACPAAGRCAWHQATGGGAEGGAHPLDLTMHATAARSEHPREHHRLRRHRTGARAELP
jgi:hypothetical protein